MFGVTGLRFRAIKSETVGRVSQLLSYALWSAVWVAGHILGGASVGGVLGWFGGHLPVVPRITLVLSALCLVWAWQEAKRIPNGWPQWRRQVQRQWLGRLPWMLMALGYGFQLGSAIATRIRIRTTYAALLSALLVGSVPVGAIIMVAFGAARALPALVQGPSLAAPERALRFAAAINAIHPGVVRANAVALSLAGLALAWCSLASPG